MVPKDSELWKWDIHPGSDHHPVYIAALSKDKRTATCLQTTSFNDQTIQERFRSTENTSRRRYLAVQHDNTVPHSADPVLQMTMGQKMKKQSYIHLDHFFMIETQYLVAFADGKKYLTEASASIVQQRLADFIQGKITINHDAPIRSSIADRYYKPEDLNLSSSPATSAAAAVVATLPAKKTLRRSFDQAFKPSTSSTEPVERPIKAARRPLAPRMGAFQSSLKMHKMEQPWRRMAAAVK
ncbi:hypothetical protein LTR86_001057 [Recurvomyces mirabilis]|nr:hypothetical protein LTR86_001057 [Recurvomyces mirabilis]